MRPRAANDNAPAARRITLALAEYVLWIGGPVAALVLTIVLW